MSDHVRSRNVFSVLQKIYSSSDVNPIFYSLFLVYILSGEKVVACPQLGWITISVTRMVNKEAMNHIRTGVGRVKKKPRVEPR